MRQGTRTFTPIEEYAIVGNLRSAALVSRAGSIDWAPAPFIHSPSVFAAILDPQRGGYWSIAPDRPSRSSQRYLPETNVLCTTFENEAFACEVIDFMPIDASKVPPAVQGQDTGMRIKRKVVCLRGTCTMRTVFAPRFNFARSATTLSLVPGGVAASGSEGERAFLVSPFPLAVSADQQSATGTFSLAAGERCFFVFRYNVDSYHSSSEAPGHHEEDFDRTETFWRAWTRDCEAGVCRFPHLWREEVLRSLLTLKILFFEPTGTVAAAATTSLPEWIGGARNWDYRYVWLRDAAFTFQALFRAGHATEAQKFLQFLVSKASVLEQGGDLAIMYALDGGEVPPEETLEHLEGYEGSKPVRIGNAARDQHQWDIYGSVLEALWRYYRLTGRTAISPERWHLVALLAQRALAVWREPDEGIWEIRDTPRHFTYSKVMCWVALDRALRIARACGVLNAPIAQWKEARDEIRQAILAYGYDSRRQAFVQAFDFPVADASLLLLPSLGFIDGKDPRMRSTIRFIEQELLAPGSSALLYRYQAPDGLGGREGVFLLASFWLADAHYHAGDYDRAHEVMEEVLRHANHVGLFSEELDPATGRFLGNFPQAYTHIGLINSAFLLSNGE